MTPINSMKNLDQFVDHVVAFQYSDGPEGFCPFEIDSSPNVKFGTLSFRKKENEYFRYFLVSFKDPKDGKISGEWRRIYPITLRENYHERGGEFITDCYPDNLNEIPKMRAATPYEVSKLQSAVNLKLANHASQISFPEFHLNWEELKTLAKQVFVNQITFILGNKDKGSLVHCLPQDILRSILFCEMEISKNETLLKEKFDSLMERYFTWLPYNQEGMWRRGQKCFDKANKKLSEFTSKHPRFISQLPTQDK